MDWMASLGSYGLYALMPFLYLLYWCLEKTPLPKEARQPLVLLGGLGAAIYLGGFSGLSLAYGLVCSAVAVLLRYGWKHYKDRGR
ncbi:MAG: hypothetical protein ACOYI4_01740 [Christensenellales bacterium]|jgi:hypothetical protein